MTRLAKKGVNVDVVVVVKYLAKEQQVDDRHTNKGTQDKVNAMMAAEIGAGGAHIAVTIGGISSMDGSRT